MARAAEVVCVDLDCFYAQALERLRPELRGAPLAVRQKYITVTCNYEARRAGVTKLMGLEEARARCPALRVVDGSDLRPFREASEEIAAVLQTFGCPLERKGMDEAFLDVTALVDARLGALEAPRDLVGHVLGDVDALDGVARARLAIASAIAQDMREALVRDLRFRSCAGVGTCKTSAKLAAELHKPDQQSVILPDALPGYMADLPAIRIQGLGRAMLRQIFAVMPHDRDDLADAGPYALRCEQIRRLSLADLTRALGAAAQARFVYNVVRGVDDRPVKPSAQSKTISQEETSLPHPDTWESADDRLRELCGRIMEFVRARREKHQQVARTVRVSVSDKAGGESRDSQSFQSRAEHETYRRRNRRHVSKQCKVDETVFSSADALHRCAQKLLRGCLPASSSAPFVLCRINLAIADFCAAQQDSAPGSQQRGLRDFFAAPVSSSSSPAGSAGSAGSGSQAKSKQTPEAAASRTTSAAVIDLSGDDDTAVSAAPGPRGRPVKRAKITSYFGKTNA